MKHVQLFAMAIWAVCVSGVVTFAHPIVVKGTVVSADPDYLTVRVVINEQTKETETHAYALNEDTRIFRGDKAVTFEAAEIQAGEPVEVTYEIDALDDWAEVIILKKK